MKDHIKYVCELIRDVFHIKREPIPVTIHQNQSRISLKLKWTGIIVWCGIIFTISNLVIRPFPFIDTLMGESSSINLSELNKSELTASANRLNISNITLLELDSSDNEFVSVLWTCNAKELYDVHTLTDSQRLMLDPLIMSFLKEGFCFNSNKSSVYCSLNSKYIVLIDSKSDLAQSHILFVYRSIKHQLYD